MPTSEAVSVLPPAPRPHWIAAMTTTGRMKRNGRVRSEREVFVQLIEGPLLSSAAGTSQRGSNSERALRMRRAVKPKLVDLKM